MTSTARVAQHYNERKQVSRTERKQSPIIHLKGLNNWVKSVLYTLFVKPGDTLLDLCCGKLGDLSKQEHAKIGKLYAADVAEKSVRRGEERYRSSKTAKFTAHFWVTDCHVPDGPLKDGVPKASCDAVSCQFALHYSFQSEERARGLWRIVSDKLKTGGVFFGTLPDASVILRQGKRVIETPLCRLALPEHTSATYGVQYDFALVDAIDNCPEYLVRQEHLCALATEYGFECKLWANFHAFVTDNIHTHKALFRHMGAVDERTGQVPDDDWDVANLYAVFAFVKTK